MPYYYSLDQVNTVDFMAYTNNSPYSGISMTKLMDKTYNRYTDGKITFVGYRLMPSALFTKAQYNETITLQTNNSMVVASQTYEDSGNSFETTVNFVDYMIHNATGIFKGKKWLRINFFKRFGRKLRIITLL
jgi:hypothetical protein